jgi:predicted metal-dependent hydrolase
MPSKQFTIDGIGAVTVVKRRNSRHVRLTVNHRGQVKVSIPAWAPYRAGTTYAATKKAWLSQHLAQALPRVLADGQAIGRQHYLRFESKGIPKVRTRVTDQAIIINYPVDSSPEDEAAQTAANKACQRALQREAEDYIPPRLRQLAAANDLSFKSITIRHLTSRWGSCDSGRNIKISLFIMQLPSELVDYVLLHELAHTRHLNHGAGFWELLMQLDPAAKEHRRQIRQVKPVV